MLLYETEKEVTSMHIEDLLETFSLLDAFGVKAIEDNISFKDFFVFEDVDNNYSFMKYNNLSDIHHIPNSMFDTNMIKSGNLYRIYDSNKELLIKLEHPITGDKVNKDKYIITSLRYIDQGQVVTISLEYPDKNRQQIIINSYRKESENWVGRNKFTVNSNGDIEIINNKKKVTYTKQHGFVTDYPNDVIPAVEQRAYIKEIVSYYEKTFKQFYNVLWDYERDATYVRRRGFFYK